MIWYLGTHNSGTSSKLVWWQRPFKYLLNLTSQCQSLSIEEQCEIGVKVFNFQVTLYNGNWVFSHGLCIYNYRFLDALAILEKYASKDVPIYYQLYLDKNIFLGQKVDKFIELVYMLNTTSLNVKMLNAWVEGTDFYPYKSDIKLDLSEKYWTIQNTSGIDKLPIPKVYANKYNKKFIAENKSEYLMLDFVNK